MRRATTLLHHTVYIFQLSEQISPDSGLVNTIEDYLNVNIHSDLLFIRFLDNILSIKQETKVISRRE